jgi:hypothetical protein
MTRSARSVHGFGNPVVGFLVVKRFARLGEDLGMASLALALHAFEVFAMRKGYVAVLGFKQYGFGWNARG